MLARQQNKSVKKKKIREIQKEEQKEKEIDGNTQYTKALKLLGYLTLHIN